MESLARSPVSLRLPPLTELQTFPAHLAITLLLSCLIWSVQWKSLLTMNHEQGRDEHGPHGVYFVSSHHVSLPRRKCVDDSKNFSVGGTNRESTIDIHTLLLLSRVGRVRLCATP